MVAMDGHNVSDLKLETSSLILCFSQSVNRITARKNSVLQQEYHEECTHVKGKAQSTKSKTQNSKTENDV